MTNNKSIYTPTQLFKYHMEDEECSIWEQLKEDIINICNKLKIFKEYFYYVDTTLNSDWEQRCGYQKECGFYSVYCERGNYSINDALPEIDYEKAKYHFLKNIIWNIGVKVESSNREILKKKWKSKIVNYDSRKYHFEYEISMLNKALGKEYIDKLIKERIDYMNRWFYIDHWGFDYKEMQFIEISDSKEHSSRHFIKVKNDIDFNISILRVGKIEIKFVGIIKDIMEYQNGICIRLESSKRQTNNALLNNVYMIDFDGNISWNIKDILSDYLGSDKNEWYPDICKLNDNTLRIFSYRCITFDIDLNSGEIINKIVAK